MNIEQMLKYRENRDSRLPHRPFVTFFDVFKACEKAASEIINKNDVKHQELLERYVVIGTVTAIEVYFKDVLDGIFRLCEPVFYESKIKHIHSNKYDINDLIKIEKNGLSATELVVSSQSFQNAEVIDKVFSKFIDKSFWNTVLEQKIRRESNPESIVGWDSIDFKGLKNTFKTRHELVHDPAKGAFLTAEVHKDLWRAAHMVWGADVILMSIIANNALQPISR